MPLFGALAKNTAVSYFGKTTLRFPRRSATLAFGGCEQASYQARGRLPCRLLLEILYHRNSGKQLQFATKVNK